MDATRTDVDPIAQTLPADVTRREVVVRLGAGGLAAFLLAAGQRPMRVAAQDATPTGAVGVTAQPMGGGQPASAPGLELTLRRITIAPGGRIPHHTHPGALLIFVEAGTWGYTTLGGTALLTRAAVGGTPTPAESMPMGTEVILNPGDWLFTEDPVDDVRNAGDDDVVVLVAGLTRVGEPFTSFMSDMEMGTPAS
ncbi:MAG: cupin domain-containing protein [Chloroflexota bacterium]|nr:cupin domain-containing protein [Chloroflexota bacterium]